MQRHHVALLEERLLIGYGVNTGLLDDLGGAVGVEGVDLHAEALGDASHIATHVAEGEDSQFLAQQLRAALAVIETANCHHQQSKHQLGHGVGVLAGSVLGYHVVGGGSG